MPQIAVTDAAPVLVAKGAEIAGQYLTMRTDADVYLGAVDVTAATGLLLTAADGIVRIALDDGDALYGIAPAAGTPTVGTLVL